MAWLEIDEDALQKNNNLLKTYRAVKGYTIDALNQAIEKLQDSIDKESDSDLKSLLTERQTSLKKSLEEIESDFE